MSASVLRGARTQAAIIAEGFQRASDEADEAPLPHLDQGSEQ